MNVSAPTDKDLTEAEILLEISRFAVSNKFKLPIPKNAVAIELIDVGKVIEYLKQNYNITRKSP